MWQPNPAQWRIIWIVAVVLILGWPGDRSRSLGMKMVNWLADPYNSLPVLPAPLPIGLDDDGDAVAAHDADSAEYYRAYMSSPITRLRLKLRDAADPFEASTERQILVGLAILSALAVWRLNGKANHL